jgi:hypothetical protein
VLRKRPPCAPRRQIAIVPPPIESDFLCLVERTDEQSDPDRQEFDFRQRNLDVARDHKSFVEYPIQYVDKTGGAMMRGNLEGHARSDL